MSNLNAVALHAGVSIRTVRRVLYDPALVRPATAARVRAAVAELGYAPNPYARALVVGRSDAVALIAPPPVWYVSNTLLVTLQRRIAELGLHAVLLSGASSEAAGAVAASAGLAPRAVVLVQVEWQEQYRELSGAGAPLLAIDVFPGLPENVPGDAIGLDRTGAFRSATEHLISLGHRHIGLLNYYSARGRIEGYTAAMQAADLDHRAVILCDATGDHAPTIRPALEQLLGTCPGLTAIVCTTDVYAVEVMHHLAAMGLSVPEDISLTSYSNEPWTPWTRPALTTLDQRTDVLCEQALEMMRRRLEGSEEPWDHQVVRPELVVRGSTAPPRTRR